MLVVLEVSEDKIDSVVKSAESFGASFVGTEKNAFLGALYNSDDVVMALKDDLEYGDRDYRPFIRDVLSSPSKTQEFVLQVFSAMNKEFAPEIDNVCEFFHDCFDKTLLERGDKFIEEQAKPDRKKQSKGISR